jgi:hypothetical protein
MKMIRTLILLLAGLGVANAATLTLDNPNLMGAPGQTVGWGFTLTADPTNWITVVGSTLINESNSSLGTYSDRIALQGGPVDFFLAPGPTNWIQSFDLLGSTGLGSYTIDFNAVEGAINNGELLVVIELFSSTNPADCSESCYVGTEELIVPFSVMVGPSGSSEVPEPSTLGIVGLGAAALLAGRRKRT